MAGGPLEKARPMDHRAALGIVGPKHKPADAGMANGTGTHSARLEGNDQRQAG